MTQNKINQATPEIAQWHNRWAKNRDFMDGEEAVKSKGEAYLPKVRCDDSAAEYQAHTQRTLFFPAASKIEQGLTGLVFRKCPQFETNNARADLLSQLISPSGQSREDLAEAVVRETLITNFTGLLVDHPDASLFKDLSAANADRKGFRPYVSLYVAESILEATQGIVGNSIQLVHVRLSENAGTQVRKLLINDNGFYEVRLYGKLESGDFQLLSSAVPVMNGQPMTEIPFLIINSHGKTSPTPSILQHCVDLNLSHYRYEGSRAATIHYTSAPIAVVKGYAPEDGAEPMNWDMTPGAVWEIANPEAAVEWFTYDPKGSELLIETLKDLKDQLSTIGHSILAPEKAAPEAPEYGMIRKVAENATLAAFVRTVSRQLEKAFQTFAHWVDPKATVSFTLNMDFDVSKLGAAEIKALSDLVAMGLLSRETFLLALKDNDVVSPKFDPTLEAERIQNEGLDQPTADF